MFGSTTFAEKTFAGYGVNDLDVTYIADQPFVMHLHSDSNVFLRKIEGFTKGTWDEKINSAHTLKFDLPIDGALAQTDELKSPNRIKLYNASMERMQQFSIIKAVSKPSKGVLSIEAKSLLYLLGQEYTPFTSFGSMDSLVGDHIATLLSYQQSASPIKIGRIQGQYKNASNLSLNLQQADKSILDAIVDVWSYLGGVFGVDGSGNFFWKSDSVKYTPFTLNLKSDIVDYSYTRDESKIINRIYPKGTIQDQGVGTANRLRVLPSGTNYVQDTGSAAIYGIRAKFVSFATSETAELVALSNKMLSVTKDPIETRKIGVIDLARLQLDPDNPGTPHPEYLRAGNTLRIEPPSNSPNDSTFSALILSSKRDLGNPLLVKVTLGDSAMTKAVTGKKASGIRPPSETEFFDILAEGLNSDDEPDEYDEYILDGLEDLWQWINDNIADSLPPSDNDAEIQAVSNANDAGGAFNTVARADHTHDGIEKFVDIGTYLSTSDFPTLTTASWAMAWIDPDDATVATDAGEWMWYPGTSTWARPIAYYA